jgi:hypothetical protein
MLFNLICVQEVAPIPDEIVQVLRKWFEICRTIGFTSEKQDQMEAEERQKANIYRQMVDAVLSVLPNAPDRW